MDSAGKWQTLLLAAALAALVTLPVAAAGASASGASAAKPNKRIKALNKRLTELETSLGQRLAALEARANAAPTVPAGGELTGPAGGDLIGTYPNPSIAPDAVGSSEIAADAVGSSELLAGVIGSTEIADGAVTTEGILNGTIGSSDIGLGSVTGAQIRDDSVGKSELALGSVGARELGSVESRQGPEVLIPAGTTGTATVTCPPTTRLLGGGFDWDAPLFEGMSVISTSPTFVGDPERTWQVVGRVEAGAVGQRRLIARAICLHS